eukprot:330082_1
MKLSNIHPNHLTAIEYISVIDIEKNTWQYTNGELVRGLEMTRPVLYNQYIYVVGGYYFDSGETDTNIIHIIDTSTNMVSISQQTLVYGIYATAPIIMQIEYMHLVAGRV